MSGRRNAVADAPSTAADRVLIVRGGGQRWALPLHRVLHVGDLPRLTRLPHAPAAMLGVTTHRGDIVPVLDLAHLLGAAESDADRIALVRRAGQVVGLRLAAIDAVRRVAAGELPTLDVDALEVPEPEAPRVGAGAGAAWTSAPAPAPRERGLLARLGARHLWLRLADVVEVLDGVEAVAVPWADPRAPAVLIRDDEVLPVVRLDLLLGGRGPGPEPPRGPLVVARFRGGRAAFRVDAVAGLTERDPALPPLALDSLLTPLPGSGAEVPTQVVPQRQGAREGAYLAIVLADQPCLLPLRDVGAVADHVRPTRLPAGAPARLIGVRAIGGHILPMVDPRADLGLDRRTPPAVDVVVAASGAPHFVITAQRLDGVVRLDAGAIHATGRGGAVTGIARVAGRLAWVLASAALCGPRVGA